VDDAESGGPGMLGGAVGQRRTEGGGANPEPNATGPGPDSFTAPVHGVLISNDNIVYVSDRANRRVQLFSPQGKYLDEFFVNRAGPRSETASGLAFSPDRQQKYLYVADYGNSHVLVLDRKSLKILYQFGQRGVEPGNFRGIHHIAVDAQGNLYTAEVAPGARIQKFVFKGLSATLPPNALGSAQLPPQ